jgi:hypothetical protein
MDEEFSPALLTGCVLLASRCWALPCNTCRALRPPHADQPATGGELAAHRLPPTNDPCVPPALSWSATRSSWPLPNHLPRRWPGPNRRLGWPSTACGSFEHQAPTQADDEPGMDAAGDHADPGHPSRPAACPTVALQDLTSAGHSGRGNAQTPDADTGRRTPGRSDAHTGHRTPVPWTGKRGHWSPDTGRGRGQGDEGSAGIRTSATTPSDRALGRPTVFLWTAPAALGSPCRLGGEAAFQREIASRRQLLGRSTGVERRLGALLSSDDYGSRVERTESCHPLCSAGCGAADVFMCCSADLGRTQS